MLPYHEPSEKSNIIINQNHWNDIDIDINNLTVNNITNNSAILTINNGNENYFGEIEIIFSLDSNTCPNINLSTENNFNSDDEDESKNERQGYFKFGGKWIEKDWSSSKSECEQINLNNNNNIEKWYKFSQPDELKISINKKTWGKEIKPHIEKIINTVNKFPVSDHSLFQKYNEENRNMIIGSVAYNYTNVNAYFEKSNTQVLTIDKQLGNILLSTDFYYNDYYDYLLINNKNNNSNSIEKWYKFLQPDQLKISINKETWEKEIKLHIQAIINTVNKFPVSDYSLFQKYNEENRNNLIASLIRHFTEINDGFFQSRNYLSITISTFGFNFNIEINETKNKIIKDEH